VVYSILLNERFCHLNIKFLISLNLNWFWWHFLANLFLYCLELGYWFHFCHFCSLPFSSMLLCPVTQINNMCMLVLRASIVFSCIFPVMSVVFVLFCILFSILRESVRMMFLNVFSASYMYMIVMGIAMASAVYIEQLPSSLYLIEWFSLDYSDPNPLFDLDAPMYMLLFSCVCRIFCKWFLYTIEFMCYFLNVDSSKLMLNLVFHGGKLLGCTFIILLSFKLYLFLRMFDWEFMLSLSCITYIMLMWAGLTLWHHSRLISSYSNNNKI